MGMVDYTRGDDPVYNGFRDGWKSSYDAKEEDIELNEIVDGIDRDRLREICDADKNGILVMLPCKVSEIISKYKELTKQTGDEVETYATGYRNGYKNGQAELIAYLLQLGTGNCAEVALEKEAERE